MYKRQVVGDLVRREDPGDVNVAGAVQLVEDLPCLGGVKRPRPCAHDAHPSGWLAKPGRGSLTHVAAATARRCAPTGTPQVRSSTSSSSCSIASSFIEERSSDAI